MTDKDMGKLEKAHSISQVAIELGIKVKGSVGRCFHQDRHHGEVEDYSLFFNVAQNTFFCKTCPDVGGSVIDLVCQYKSWKREEAVAWLAHRQEFNEMTRNKFKGKGRKKFPGPNR